MKLPFPYAQTGVPEVWLVDLTSETVLIHLRPSPEGYLEIRRVGRGEILFPEATPRLQIAVESILG